MRRLVAISNKTQKLMMALVAVTVTLTSLHMAAAARIESLRREQEALSNQTAVPSRGPLSAAIQPANPKHIASTQVEQTGNASSQQGTPPVVGVATPGTAA